MYAWYVSRTNIELDDELLAEAMRRFGVRTKREAVDLALRRLVGASLTPEFVRSLDGIGWEGDLDEMRASRGMTVRKLVDCLIAAVAVRTRATLVHEDSDFDAIAAVAPLDTHRPG